MPAQASISNSSIPSKRPAWIVVFNEPSERNASVLSKCLKLGQAKGLSARAGVSMLAAKSPDRADVKVYNRLGVAATDLTEEERNQLIADKSVMAVVPNHVRRVPPFSFLSDEMITTVSQSTIQVPLSARSGDPMLAYLQGSRDALEAIIQFYGGKTNPAPRQTFAAPLATWSWCLEQIGITRTYSVATGKNIKIAVLDTGIDLTHPDFRGALQEGNNAVSFVVGESVQDNHGHGTHCAGIIGGAASSIGGIRYSVAPDVNLLVGKVLNNAGRGFDNDILDGIDWAAEMGARVISMSLGSERDLDEDFAVPYERVADRLLNGSPGILLVAAAGNESMRPSFTRPVGNPAACPSFLSVAAVDVDRRVGSFSCAQMDNVGTLDISGPGVAVYSTWTGGGFKTISGTSMATPHVAGVAALFVERNSKLNGKQLWHALISNAVPIGSPNDFGQGLVHVPQA